MKTEIPIVCATSPTITNSHSRMILYPRVAFWRVFTTAVEVPRASPRKKKPVSLNQRYGAAWRRSRTDQICKGLFQSPNLYRSTVYLP